MSLVKVCFIFVKSILSGYILNFHTYSLIIIILVIQVTMSSVVNVVSNKPKLKNIILLLIVTVNVRTLFV